MQRELPNLDTHSCFGCSPRNDAGLKMIFKTDGSKVFSHLQIPQHLCGWENLAHGGILATILDEIMGRTIIYNQKKLGLTKTMTIAYSRPVFVGEDIDAIGEVVEIISEHEAHVRGQIRNHRGKLCAEAEGRFVLFTAQALRRKNITDTQSLDWFEELIARDEKPGM